MANRADHKSSKIWGSSCSIWRISMLTWKLYGEPGTTHLLAWVSFCRPRAFWHFQEINMPFFYLVLLVIINLFTESQCSYPCLCSSVFVKVFRSRISCLVITIFSMPVRDRHSAFRHYKSCQVHRLRETAGRYAYYCSATDRGWQLPGGGELVLL